MIGVDVADLVARDVGEGFGGAEVCEEEAVALQDVGFISAVGDGVGCVGPGAGVLGGVFGAEV